MDVPIFRLFLCPDLVRMLLFQYLDGPSACNLLRTCRRFHYFMKHDYKGLKRLRFAPKDHNFYIKRVLERAHVCVKCYGINKCYRGCNSDQDSEFFVRCGRCSVRGNIEDMQPWLVHLYPVGIKCWRCKRKLDMQTDHRDTSGCLKCGITCRVCNGKYDICGVDGCTFEDKIIFIQRHRDREHKSVWRSIYEYFNPPQADDLPPPPPPARRIRMMRTPEEFLRRK